MDWDHPNSLFPMLLLSLLSIPSHCTMRGNGQTGVIPNCPIWYLGGNEHTLFIQSVPIPTVHPIPLYHGREWTDYTMKLPMKYVIGKILIVIMPLLHANITEKCELL